MWIFLRILYLYRKKVVWIVGLRLGCVVGKSVEFSRVLRYWVRYLDFGSGWLKSGDFVGFCWILVEWFNF